MGIRVLVASHIRLYREALGRVLEQAREQARGQTTEQTAEVVLVGLAASAADAVEQVCRLAPDVALLDMAMSDAFSAWYSPVSRLPRPRAISSSAFPRRSLARACSRTSTIPR